MADTDIKISTKDLFGSLGYLTTKSGPVEPGRAKLIKTMKATLKPVGDQTSQKWDRRKYENDSLLMKKNYLSLKDIGVKIMTEATSSTSYEPMRLNISGIDLEEGIFNGSFRCDNQLITLNLKYPNANGEITVELALDSGDCLTKDVPLESDEFKGNFSFWLREQAHNLILQRNGSTDSRKIYEGLGAVSMPHNDFNSELNLATKDTMNFTESVDWQMQELLELCNKAAMYEAGATAGGGGDFTEEDFAMPGDDQNGGGDPTMGGGSAAVADDGTLPPANAGEVNSADGSGNGKGEKTVEFREYALDKFTQAAWDGMAQIAADGVTELNEQGSSGVKPSASEWYDGFPGMKNLSPEEILDQVLSLDDFKALDTSLPEKGLDEFAKTLEDGKIDITRIKTDLGKWFPTVYNTDGTAMHDVAKEAAAQVLPQDDKTGVGVGAEPSQTYDLSSLGDTGDMMNAAQEFAGGPNANENDLGGDEDETMDNTDMAIGSLDNIF